MDWGDTSCYSRHFLINRKELKDALARTKIKILILTFPTAQSLQLSGMIKKEQINFGNIVIMMSKFGSKSERGNIKFYVFLGTLIITFYFLGNMGVDKFKKNVKFAPAKVTSDFHYKNTFGGSGYDYSFILNGKLYNRTQSKGNFIKENYYLVAYDSTSPKSTQLLEINITDSLNQSCINGWTLKEIPFKVDTIYIKKKINEL